MNWLLGALALVFVLDALRMRARLAGLAPLPPDGPEAAGELLAAPGVEVDAETRRAAAAFARERDLQVVDLVPREIPTWEALALAQLVDLPRFRGDRLAHGASAGYAIYATDDVRRRSGVEAPASLTALLKVAKRLKHYAPVGFDFAVAPRLAPRRAPDALRIPALVLAIQGVVYALLVLGVLLPGARGMGLAALVAFHLQPLIALPGSAVRPRDLSEFTLLRTPLEIGRWLGALRAALTARHDDPIEARRPVYGELLAAGTGRFFEPRRMNCPICGATDLAVHLRTSDLIQHKPGTFTLERCGDCGHIFQNPRLSLEGLGFYYKDAYDGLGEEQMDFIFGNRGNPYEARARAIGAAPRRWLDVGGGHGHFCLMAREVWPQATFDCLDLSESVDEAARRGWVNRGYRGLFPDFAPSVAGEYDVVSMSHYLEHTLDPAAEIAAAGVALEPGGRLLIEVPDPDSPLGRLLGRWWIPWFQPQHLHLLSVRNIERLLRRNGFEPETWHRGEAHQKVDFLFAAGLMLHRLGRSRMPWRPPLGVADRVRQVMVYSLGAPLVLLGALVDNLANPLVRRLNWSNTYRVVARKQPAGGAESHERAEAAAG